MATAGISGKTPPVTTEKMAKLVRAAVREVLSGGDDMAMDMLKYYMK